MHLLPAVLVGGEHVGGERFDILAVVLHVCEPAYNACIVAQQRQVAVLLLDLVDRSRNRFFVGDVELDRDELNRLGRQ